MRGSQNPPHQNHRRGGAWPAGSFENTSNVQQFVMLILPGKEKYLPDFQRGDTLWQAPQNDISTKTFVGH